MTVYIEKPAVNLREELASLRNQGGYEEQQFWMEGLLPDPRFELGTTTGWTATGSAGLSIVSNQLKINNNAANFGGASYRLSGLNVGAVYKVTSSLVIGNTNVTYRVRDQNGSTVLDAATVSATGSVTLTVTTISNAFDIQIINADSTLNDFSTVDNVLVLETDGTNVVHRMPKGWVPLHVYEDGLLQREGAANDYTVVYDGFDYYVKPAVAPSATTQTCVIGVRK